MQDHRALDAKNDPCMNGKKSSDWLCISAAMHLLLVNQWSSIKLHHRNILHAKQQTTWMHWHVEVCRCLEQRMPPPPIVAFQYNFFLLDVHLRYICSGPPHHPGAWMTHNLFKEQPIDIENKIKFQKWNILPFIDNCCAQTILLKWILLNRIYPPTAHQFFSLQILELFYLSKFISKIIAEKRFCWFLKSLITWKLD